MRIRTTDILARKHPKTGTAKPIVCLTAYTAPIAKILDKHTDILLVGDTLGMVVYGMDSTLTVTLEMMANHGRAVVNASKNALVVVDMPFASYQTSKEEAFKNAAYLMQKTSCQAVKMEAGAELAETVRFLTERGIPVMGHVGLMPQYHNVHGGYKTQGFDKATKDKILNDAKKIEDSGAFAIVIESVKAEIADLVSKKLKIPVIGIGGSKACDGQVLVSEDMLGLFTDFTPKFVKQYANLAKVIDTATAEYAREVRSRKFPGPEHIKS